ncbi:MAG: hypothetical protein IPN36_13545 [Bacteroidetes bacterium]|nr:hypothetical protein [Bacteroidota bacterium]
MSALKNIFSFGRGNKSSVTFLICFVLATCIWVLNSLNNSHATTVRIPVSYDLKFRDRATSQIPEFLEIDVKARGFTLMEFVKVSRRYKIRPLENSNFSTDTVMSSMDAVWPLMREFGKEIEITRIHPKQFFLSGNKSFSKKVAVKGNFRLKFKPSFLESGPFVFYPDSVFLFSSTPIPEEMKDIYTENIVFENADKDIFRKLKLQLPRGDYHLSSKESWLLIPIEPGTEITLEVPIISNNRYASEVFIPNYVKVTCLVPLSKFTGTKPGLFSFVTEASALNSDKVIVRLKRKPYWAGKIRWEPTTVKRFAKNIKSS